MLSWREVSAAGMWVTDEAWFLQVGDGPQQRRLRITAVN